MDAVSQNPFARTYFLYNYSTGGGAEAIDFHTASLVRSAGTLILRIQGANRGSSNRLKEFTLPELGEGFQTIELQFAKLHPTFGLSYFYAYFNGVKLVDDTVHNHFYADNLQFNSFRLRGDNFVVYIAVFERSAARRKTSELEIIKAANNTFPANPINKENLLLYWQCNQIGYYHQ